MAPEQESNARAGGEEAAQPPRVYKRSGRSGRGRRGRGGRGPARPPAYSSQTPHEIPKTETLREVPSPRSEAEPSTVRDPSERPSAPEHSSSSAIQNAIGEVNHIIESLRETLDEMEEVLETLELAERQKDSDEREVESLRHALRNLQRARESPRNPS